MTLTLAQLAARREVVGSSDIACLFTHNGRSLSPWGGPRDVYLQKVHDIHTADTAQTEAGTYLEPAVLDWFQARMRASMGENWLQIFRGETVKHPTCTRMAANLDGLLTLPDAQVPVEVKTVNPFAPSAHEWQPEGSAEIPVPFHYYLQLQFQMACCGAPYGFLVALMGTHELREYRFDARPALHARMVEVVERFWREHVEPRVEPSGPPPREEILRAVPREEGASVSVDDALVLGYDDAKRAAREAQAREDDAKRALLAALGDAEIGESGVGRVTFKADRRGVRTLRLKMTEEVHGDAAAFV